MIADEIKTQAAELEELLPQVMRSLFALDPDHPLAEMPLAQIRVCTLLLGGPCTCSALADMLRISPSAVSQLADRLERAGMVERVHEQEDRRVKHLRLTRTGENLMLSRRRIRREHAAAALSRLTPQARNTVLDALRFLLDVGYHDVAPGEESLLRA